MRLRSHQRGYRSRDSSHALRWTFTTWSCCQGHRGICSPRPFRVRTNSAGLGAGGHGIKGWDYSVLSAPDYSTPSPSHRTSSTMSIRRHRATLWRRVGALLQRVMCGGLAPLTHHDDDGEVGASNGPCFLANCCFLPMYRHTRNALRPQFIYAIRLSSHCTPLRCVLGPHAEVDSYTQHE